MRSRTPSTRWASPGGIASALAGLWALAGCTDDGGPRLVTVSPTAASHGTMVMITGRRLCGPSSDCTMAAGEVDLGLDPPMVRVTVVSYSDTGAQIVIPTVAPLGMSALIVTVDERSSNALGFEVLP